MKISKSFIFWMMLVIFVGLVACSTEKTPPAPTIAPTSAVTEAETETAVPVPTELPTPIVPTNVIVQQYFLF